MCDDLTMESLYEEIIAFLYTPRYFGENFTNYQKRIMRDWDLMRKEVSREKRLRIYLPKTGSEPDRYILDQVIFSGTTNFICVTCNFSANIDSTPSGINWYNELPCPKCTKK